MSHSVGDNVAPTVDSSGGGIGHILKIRFRDSGLLPKPAIFRLSPPPFSRRVELFTDPADSSLQITATVDVVSSFQGIVHRLPTKQTRTALSATAQATPLLLPRLPHEVPAVEVPSLVSVCVIVTMRELVTAAPRSTL